MEDWREPISFGICTCIYIHVHVGGAINVSTCTVYIHVHVVIIIMQNVPHTLAFLLFCKACRYTCTAMLCAGKCVSVSEREGVCDVGKHDCLNTRTHIHVHVHVNIIL